MGGSEFNPYARDWISAMNRLDPYGDDLPIPLAFDANNQINVLAAHTFADRVKEPYDTPVFKAKNGGEYDTLES